MPADHDTDHPLTAAARRRHELARSKAIRALRELDGTGAPVTFDALARHADVSRSWLYTQPDLRDEIQRLREIQQPAAALAIPAGQRATESSLLARLQQAHQRNRRLAEENQRLRRQLAQALGDQRATNNNTARTSSARRSSVTIGPCQ